MAVVDEDIDWQLIKNLVFGEGITENVFERWLQPFQFFKNEPTALVQHAGGPCAVLAPLQAFIIKLCLEEKIQNLQTLSEQTARMLLRRAICDILSICRPPNRVITLATVSKEVASVWQESLEVYPSSKRMKCENVDVDTLHTCLTLETFQTVRNLNKFIEDNQIFGSKYDIVCFLYSVILTRGPTRIINERQDMDESLIDPVHGHGSQSLINLLITGSATQNVFDGTRDLCGMDLTGITEQSQIGFLSFLECLRYLEVGENLKSPKFPVWLLGSETHITVLYSRDLWLVQPPSPREKAIRIFKELDKDGSGFIPTSQLQELLTNLNLFAEEEYVAIMKDRVDPDGLGLVLMPLFLEEFFPEFQGGAPDSFTLYHYNGLSKTGSGEYIKGEAVLLEGMSGRADNNPMLQTIQTKWPSIAVDWERPPSIN
ncbi:ubiquitin carboxyl-terminal hydrolase MINDY-3 isoform X1 [Eurytemora carolleeae]|uniref:ubiquitin carboxyl-terminal hydrolase MINDY-3 isoform X1 n=1 Tax=Eurytemora carolleeae TaxID=1294199 RepID=UPI000C755C75|nr:ubiquitin carboxyl-terminal hydrolase MINDY-3 isoform X1 [Eurytemora carolleeae]|eukprot:XP_023336532.1 ubiquitin carboxyl-terminal hydrolase MINDY-3-like isoform X1 [Eurytemora affinis]